MDPLGQRALRRCWKELVDDLDPAVDVLDFLLAHGEETGMTFDKYRELQGGETSTRHQRAASLLLHAVDHCPLGLLLQALEAGQSHPHLAHALRRQLDQLQAQQSDPPLPREQEVTSRVADQTQQSYPPLSREQEVTSRDLGQNPRSYPPLSREQEVTSRDISQTQQSYPPLPGKQGVMSGDVNQAQQSDPPLSREQEVTSRGVCTGEATREEEKKVSDMTVQQLMQCLAKAAEAPGTQLGKRGSLHLTGPESTPQGRQLLPAQGKQLRRDCDLAVDFPMLRGPGRVAVPPWRKAAPLDKLCRSILHIQFGKVSFTQKELSRIRAMLQHNPQIRGDADARFLAAALNVQFGLGERGLGGLEEMERLYPGTRTPQLSLVVLLTMKGHLSTLAGRVQEAQAYLDAARITSRSLEPCAATLYCLRTFACLKRELLYSSGSAEDRGRLLDVLNHARDVIAQTGVREDNGGTVMVLHRQMARCYMGYHPWKNPPFQAQPSAWDLQGAEFALSQAEECMRQMGRQPTDDSIHCLASAALGFLRRDSGSMELWLEKGKAATVTYKNFHTDALRLRRWVKEQGELTAHRD